MIVYSYIIFCLCRWGTIPSNSHSDTSLIMMVVILTSWMNEWRGLLYASLFHLHHPHAGAIFIHKSWTWLKLIMQLVHTTLSAIYIYLGILGYCLVALGRFLYSFQGKILYIIFIIFWVASLTLWSGYVGQ